MRRLLLWAAVLVSTAACSGGSGKEPAVTAPTSITVTSPVLREGDTIPSKYTCDGKGTSPPLAWTGTPANAKALALVVDDPDAPRGTFTHWVLLDLDSRTSSIAEGTTPPGAKQANNSAGKPSYYGPCPPSGTHHYRFTVYALSKATNLADGAGFDEALEAIDAATIARGRLTALYSR
ncbi:YbhB/YbcL family Raf kinase inhibitor-like protein [Kribbella sp. NPDC049584]|uniref:YbhB/YbcL family Raf kinase inhibitor-like protein n=1 Tax=Kribbella sp. NPDC049584 TaxID=3154833 RepID=UPI0034308286